MPEVRRNSIGARNIKVALFINMKRNNRWRVRPSALLSLKTQPSQRPKFQRLEPWVDIMDDKR